MGFWLGLLIVFGAFILAGWLFVRYMTEMPGRSYAGPLAPLTPPQAAIRDELKAHVAQLAGAIGERNLPRYDALHAAAEYVRQSFEQMGYRVREQTFAAQGRTVRNLEAELPGAGNAQEIVLFGAHYDSVRGAPGANDNASGVAALLVLARLAAVNRSYSRTVRFVAFVNEEPPYYLSGEMGSRVYARAAKKRSERIVAMLALETIGYYTDAPRSQAFPFAFRLGYPDTGNFIALVSDLGSRGLVRRAIGAFRRQAQFPSEGLAAPGWIPGIGWSDHWSFWQEGYPAMMVTDTALFRYPQYHTPLDLPEALDYDRMARVAEGLAGTLDELAGRKER